MSASTAQLSGDRVWQIDGPIGDGAGPGLDGRTAIGETRWSQRATVAGEVRSMRIAPLHDSPTMELVLVDASGALSVVFLGRRSIAGVGVGTHLEVEGMVSVHKARLAMLNPTYRILR